jgi:hypothetical protein
MLFIGHAGRTARFRKAIGYRKAIFPKEVVKAKLKIRSFSAIQCIQLLAVRLGRDR